MRHYEVMIILDPDLEEDHPAQPGGVSQRRPRGRWHRQQRRYWGRRRMAMEINHKAEGIYVMLDQPPLPESVAELDRQLNLNEAIVRTKVTRPVVSKAAAKADAALGG